MSQMSSMTTMSFASLYQYMILNRLFMGMVLYVVMLSCSNGSWYPMFGKSSKFFWIFSIVRTVFWATRAPNFSRPSI